jgi:hypothetical protein
MRLRVAQGASLSVLLAVRAEEDQPGMMQRELRIVRLEHFGQFDEHQAGNEVIPGPRGGVPAVEPKEGDDENPAREKDDLEDGRREPPRLSAPGSRGRQNRADVGEARERQGDDDAKRIGPLAFFQEVADRSAVVMAADNDLLPDPRFGFEHADDVRARLFRE